MPDKPRIMVIEDNQINYRLLAVFLEEAGFEVVHAEDGPTAIEKINSGEEVNAILLDRIMPNMDGLDVLKNLKRGDLSWHIPVIMTTAALNTNQISDALLQGAYACLPKPYNKEKIVATIRDAIKDAERGNAR